MVVTSRHVGVTVTARDASRHVTPPYKGCDGVTDGRIDRSETRQRLLDMRTRLLDDLGRQMDGGTLTLLAGVNAGLAAIDAEDNATAEPAAASAGAER